MWDWTDWAITFFSLTIVAAMFGFTSMTGEIVSTARVMFYIFLGFAAMSFLFSRRVAVTIKN
jgi:uncharacterized membrane protein YtjA (UPF0391 family)